MVTFSRCVLAKIQGRRTVLAGMAAAACCALPGRGAAADPAGRVDSARGRSTALLEGSMRNLAVNAEVFLQELVETHIGARLELALGAATRVMLGERTRLRIEKSVVEQGGTVLLERGALLFDRPDSGDGFTVRMPFAIVAARGTRFFVGPSNDVLGVFCERGAVTVRNNAGRVVLTAGEGTDLTSPDVAPTPARPWGAPRIEAAVASVS